MKAKEGEAGKDEQEEAEENNWTKLQREKLQERKGGTWIQAPILSRHTKN